MGIEMLGYAEGHKKETITRGSLQLLDPLNLLFYRLLPRLAPLLALLLADKDGIGSNTRLFLNAGKRLLLYIILTFLNIVLTFLDDR